jgi:acetyl esterase/lipase
MIKHLIPLLVAGAFLAPSNAFCAETAETAEEAEASAEKTTAEEAGAPLDWEVVQYREAGDVKLTLHVMQPPGAEPEERPTVVFFVCGGWGGFNPDKHKSQSAYFVSRGMTAITALIRTRGKHGVSIEEMVKDAKCAVRYVRKHHAELGVDPERIVVSGASAAGHISACTALIDGFEHEGEDLKISSRPNAVAIFCPVLVADRGQRRIKLFGGQDRARALSPIRYVDSEAPPFLVMHSVLDSVVKPEGVKAFAYLMAAFGKRCDLRLYDYEDSGHGFQNWWGGGNPGFYGCLQNMDAFFVSLGYLQGKQTVNTFDFTPYVKKR